MAYNGSRSSPQEEVSMSPESVSYMMLFCAMLLTRNRGVALGDSLKLVPLSGGAKTLAEKLAAKSIR